MNITPALAIIPPASTMLGWLMWVAIAAIVIWAVIALIKSSSIPIPPQVWIILSAFVGIGLILLIAKFFNFLL